MISRIVFLAAAMAACHAAGAAAVAPSDIVGAWVCGPYEMKGLSSVVTAVDRTTYAASGEFRSEGSATVVAVTGDEVVIATRHLGRWELRGDVLRVVYSEAQFLSSSSELFPVAAGQARLDAQLADRNWSEKRVLESGSRLVTQVLDPRREQAGLEVTCTQAGPVGGSA